MASQVRHKSTKSPKPLVYYLALWGCISTGIVYMAIGVVALLSFFRLKNGGADEASLLVYLDKYIIGKVIIWIILLGMVALIVWRIYEVIKDPYEYGSTVKGKLQRAAIALSSVPDAMIAYTAVQAMLGDEAIKESGPPVAQQHMADELMQHSWGIWLIMGAGIITGIAALIQFGYVIGKLYLQRMDIDGIARWKRTSIHILAWSGYFARGVILSIISFFFIKAALYKSGHFIVNTDKAFDAIGDDIGHAWFILVAIATICYGLFMFLFGYYYDTDKD